TWLMFVTGSVARCGHPRKACWSASLTGRCRGLIADLLVSSVRPAIDGIRRQVGVTLLVESELTDHGVELVLVEGLDHAPHVGRAGRLRRLCPGLERGIGVKHKALRLDALVFETLDDLGGRRVFARVGQEGHQCALT